MRYCAFVYGIGSNACFEFVAIYTAMVKKLQWVVGHSQLVRRNLMGQRGC